MKHPTCTPSDLVAERNLIAGLLEHGEDAWIDASPFVNEHSFTDRANQAVFICAKNLFSKGVKKIDEASLYSSAQDMGVEWLFTKSEDLSHVRSLFNSKSYIGNVCRWAGRISKLQIARLLRQQFYDCDQNLSVLQGDESINHILGLAEKPIFDLTEMLQGQDVVTAPRTLGTGLMEHLDHIEANPVEMLGLPTGMPIYDKAIGGGWRRKTVNLIGARSGIGKSYIADNVGLFMSKRDIPTLYVDTEMDSQDHWNRCLAHLCEKQVIIDLIETGQYGKHKRKRQKVREAAVKLNSLPFYYINVSGKPFEEVLSIIRRWIVKEVGVDSEGNVNDCCVMYDYLKLMTGENINNNMAEFQILGFMTTSLHNFAVRHDVPIGAFIQLNRDGINKETTDVIAGSDRVLWLVTTFALFKPKSSDEISQEGIENGNRKLVPLKHRHGRGLGDNVDYINIKMDGGYGIVKELNTNADTKPTQPSNNDFATDSDDIPFESLSDDTEQDEPVQ